MGCFPHSGQKLKVASNEIPSTKLRKKLPNKTIRNLSDFQFNKRFHVSENKNDPYKIYQQKNQLGAGGFGEVFKVYHIELKVYRAMKIIDLSKIGRNLKSKTDLYINEIEILKSLDHPNIIKIYEYFLSGNKIYIVTELCTGGELFEVLLARETLSETTVAFVMRQIFSAISFCHNVGIMHCDIKPENIVVDNSEELYKETFTIKLIDFGTSKIFSEGKIRSKVGTYLYMAPEMLSGVEYTEACDLWSCGVMMYLLLCGEPPFLSKQLENLIEIIKKAKFSFTHEVWNTISSDSKDLIKSLLKKDVNNRISALDALNSKWIIESNQNATKVQNLDFMNAHQQKIWKDTFQNLKSFYSEHKFAEAVLSYIVHNISKKNNLLDLRKIFIQLDVNGDGRLTEKELMEGLSQYFMCKDEAETEFKAIMNAIDLDKNGYIEYEEFLHAALNKQKLLSQDNLTHAFNLFDKDKSGKISLSELREVIGKDLKTSEEVWNKMIAQNDLDSDGEISFEEFKQMMFKVININN